MAATNPRPLTHTYTLRIPGETAWAEGLTERDAIRELHAQKRQGRHLSIYRDIDDAQVYQLDNHLIAGADYDLALGLDDSDDDYLADDWSRGIA